MRKSDNELWHRGGYVRVKAKQWSSALDADVGAFVGATVVNNTRIYACTTFPTTCLYTHAYAHDETHVSVLARATCQVPHPNT